jgi:hypothetical protein
VPIDAGDTGVGETAADDAVSVGESHGDPTTITTMTSADPTGNEVSTAGSADEGEPATTRGEDGVDFITPPDGVLPPYECDIWANDCPRGEKCMPWANDGGSSWNATKCTPLAEDPNAPGEPCTVQNNGVSGIDDCEARSMCWNVDIETNTGTCVAFCSGSEANPTCESTCEYCTIASEGPLILCLPECNPLAQDCGDGQGCYPTNDTFSCVPDAGGDAGALGEPCEYLNVCDPGLVCGSPEWVPGCRGIGCCMTLCDVLDANACASAFDGAECIPWFDDGAQPPCTAGVVGVCALLVEG